MWPRRRGAWSLSSGGDVLGARAGGRERPRASTRGAVRREAKAHGEGRGGAASPALTVPMVPSQARPLWGRRTGTVAWTRGQSTLLPSARWVAAEASRVDACVQRVPPPAPAALQPTRCLRPPARRPHVPRSPSRRAEPGGPSGRTARSRSSLSFSLWGVRAPCHQTLGWTVLGPHL